MTVCRHLYRFSALALVATMIAFVSAPAQAQEYREAWNAAMEAAKAKNYQVAVDQFTAAAAGAEAEGDATVARQANGYISKIQYTQGLAELRAENFDAALALFDSGIERDPAYPKNYLARASTLKKMDNIDAAIPAFAEAAQKAEAASDSRTASQATAAIRDHFIFVASSALGRNGNRATQSDADEALEALMTLQNFVPDPDADYFYYMAEVHKVSGEFQDAVAMADQALELHRGSRTDKAKIFYVKGEALVALGNVPAAKEAFAGASFGPYKASAEHYIETLGTN